MYKAYIKIFFDKSFTIVLLMILFPILIIAIVLLKITQGKTIFFVQKRTGENMNCFNLYKFRTLVPSLSNDLSMENREFTLTGKIMRKSGFDELPQLLNILKGDMSFVGPRPLPISYEERYNKNQKKRFLVRPGITGWAQIHGKNNISWDRRFQLDLWYIDNLTPFLDIKILWSTFIMVLTYVFSMNKKHVEMPVFTGAKIL